MKKSITLCCLIFSFFIGCNDSEEMENKKEQLMVQDDIIKSKTTQKVNNDTTKQVDKKKLESNMQKDLEPVVEKIAKNIGKTNEQLFSACVSCHGADASKKALNKSENISLWTAEQIESALVGYKKGTYGREMKNIMTLQVTKLSDEEIHRLSKYIVNLKQ